ncbi:hypothetical protein ACFL0Y_00065 [Patescibacteria group bacterium]
MIKEDKETLSEEKKNKIEAEEKHRVKVRKDIKKEEKKREGTKKAKGCLILVGLFLGLFLIIGVFGNDDSKKSDSSKLTPTPVKEVEVTATVKPEEKIEEKTTEAPTPTIKIQQTGASLLPSREEAKDIVKADAENKWEDDYSMVRYEIDEQMESFDWLAKQNTHLDIMKSAMQKWENDYGMVKYEYENQVEAYESL